MGRVTRAKAAQVAETLHIDPDAVLELPGENDDVEAALDAKDNVVTPEKAELRKPLEEVAPNSAESGKAVGKKEEQEGDESAEVRKSTRGKKGRKGAKGAKEGSISEEAEHAADSAQDTQGVAGTDDGGEQTVAQEATVDGEGNLTPAMEQLQISPQQEETSADGFTPAQIPSAMQETSQLMEANESVTAESECPSNSSAQKPDIQPEILRSASPPATATPKAIDALRRDTPAKRSTSNKENMEPIEAVSPAPAAMETPEPESSLDLSISALTPAQPEVLEATPEPAAQPEQVPPQDPITAMDALDEAVEKATQDSAMPALPEKNMAAAKVKRAPSVRTTKASQARISMAQNAKLEAEKGPALGRSSSVRQSTAALGRSTSVRSSVAPQTSALGRSTSVRQSTASSSRPQPPTQGVPSKRVPSGTATTKPSSPSSRDIHDKANDASTIPHSKSRPVPLSFPTPPPPPKSKKLPTTSTFQLPGEAVAAKLKAAREARMQKEEEVKPAPFKARPAPSMSGGLKKSTSVRGTASSRARESMAASVGPGATVAGAAAAPAGHRRAKTALAGSASGVPPVAKRVSSVGKAPSMMSRPSTKTTAPAPTEAAKSGLTVSKRQSTVPAAATTKARVSSLNAGASAAPAQRATSSGGTAKGKEVYARTALAKTAAEKEKREKEAAAKKARLEASERGRQLSREWAEKQKAKKAGVGKASEKGTAKAEVLEKSNGGPTVAGADLGGGIAETLEEGVNSEGGAVDTSMVGAEDSAEMTEAVPVEENIAAVIAA